MLFANIAIAEKYDYLEEKFKAAYRWLAETDLTALGVGSYPILGEEVIANVQEYETVPAQSALFETHDKHFDIQYLVSGTELFGVCKREGLREKEHVEETDVTFYEEPECSGCLVLNPGDLVVVAPEDAHKPRAQAGEAQKVKKVVVKVTVSCS